MQIIDNLQDNDKQLINLATAKLAEKNKEPLQTVVAVARTQSGEIYNAINLYHFTGGPCAEGVLMARTLFKEDPLDTIVALHYDDAGNPEIINPCGRCRQMFNDYEPNVSVIVDDHDSAVMVRVPELLPYAYRNNAAKYSRVSKEDSYES